MENSELYLTPEIILRAYSLGIFPMAESANNIELNWIEPEERGIIPLESFHISRKMRHFLRHNNYNIKIDHDFESIISACAAPRMGADGIEDDETWINAPIRKLYGALFEQGYCHTIEIYNEDKLVGGLYGIALGSAFFGESMFHRERDTSKLALVHLVARLKIGGFTLLDTQFVTDHLKQFGTIEIPKKEYQILLKKALEKKGDFFAWPKEFSPNADEAINAISIDCCK